MFENLTPYKIDRNGTKYYRVNRRCPKCGGMGSIPQYYFNGGVCWTCGGWGHVEETVKVYTPEYEAKLAERRAKKEAEREAKLRAEAAERKAKYDAIVKAAEERKALSNYVGEVGKREFFTVTFEKKFEFETIYGIMFVRKFRDENDNVLVWKSSTDFKAEEGSKVTIKATVKGHEEYKNEKQTQLTRVALQEVL